MDLSRTASALRRAIAGQLHALRGEFAAARAELDAAADDGLPSEFLTPLAAARAALALAEGDPVAARRARRGRARRASQDPFYTPPLYSLGLRVAGRAGGARARPPPRARRTLADALLADLDALVR